MIRDPTHWLARRIRRSVLLENLARAFPALTAAERRALADAVTAHLLTSLWDIGAVWRSPDSGIRRLRVELRGSPPPAPAILASAHLGSFECALLATARELGPLTVMVRRLPAWAAGLAEAARRRAGVETVPETAGGARRLVARLREGRRVLVLVDQHAPRGRLVPFFGSPARTSPLVAWLNTRTGVPIVPAFAHRTVAGAHALRFDPALPPAKDVVRQVVAEVETAIRGDPTQWLWTHRRWKG